MRKALLIIMVVVLAIASVAAMTSCSRIMSFFKGSNPAGVYKFESVTIKGWNYETTYNIGDAPQHGDGAVFTEDSVILTLNKDGTYEFEDNSPVLNTTTTGTWEIAKDDEGNKYIKFDNENFTANYDKESLTFCYNNLDLIYYTYKMKKA